MDEIDRARVAELLASVATADDTTALAAVREADELVREAEVEWRDLLGVVPPPAAVAEPLPDGDDAALIERLLAHPDLSAEARTDVEGYRADLARGELDPMDAAYMRALAQRIGA